MKKILPLVLLGLLVVFSCSKSDDLIEPDSELKSGKMVERTIKFVKCTGTMEVVESELCADFGGLQMLIEGSGNASHLGNISVKNTLCIDSEMNPVTAIQGELTVANGDKICTMVITPPWMENGMIHYRYDVQSELCTGRFENASGYIIMWGDIDYATMTWDLKGEGQVAY